MNRKTIYTALAIIFVASLVAAIVLHYFSATIVEDLAGVPAILALCGALFQLSRDAVAFERSLRLEEAKNRFTVGATSHMANAAFDKHILFCEEYTREIYTTLEFLFRRGPHQDVLERANALADIRIKWALWLTPEVETKLVRFEGALRTIGAQAGLLADLQADENRVEPIRQAYGTFAAVMGWDNWRGEPVTKDLAAEKIVDGLRKILGIAELTRLRSELIERAADLKN
jgi:hypothetical protein